MPQYAHGIALVGFMLLFWSVLLVGQFLESRFGHIPAREAEGPRAFLYFQDWSMATWGDLIGLSLVDFVLGSAYTTSAFQIKFVTVSLIIGAVVTLLYHRERLMPRHKPDSGYPAPGRVSLFGRVHLVYFFIQSSICAAMIGLVLNGTLHGTPLLIAIVGGIIYAASYIADSRSGRLDRVS